MVATPEDVFQQLDMNGLTGRMAYVPSRRSKKREILFVYGARSTLERWRGLITYFNKFGAVTAPDLPGFGGMTSFYAIGRRPTIDAYADYLAAFVKWRYKRKKFSIVGMSFGFVIATRMLQRYPELTQRVELIVSLAGCMHYSDFGLRRMAVIRYRLIGKALTNPLVAWLCKHTVLSPRLLHKTIGLFPRMQRIFEHVDRDSREPITQAEIDLWQRYDERTLGMVLSELLRFDNCRVSIPLPLWHVSIHGDQYFDAHTVEQHLRVVYPTVHIAAAHLPMHVASGLSNTAEAAALVPPAVRAVLAKV